jgi:hypothetical protein
MLTEPDGVANAPLVERKLFLNYITFHYDLELVLDLSLLPSAVLIHLILDDAAILSSPGSINFEFNRITNKFQINKKT